MNLTRSSTGVNLDDGACALVADGKCLVAIAEERLNRRKYSGGVKHAIDYCLAASGLKMEEIDLVVGSICTDLPPTSRSIAAALSADGFQVAEDRVIACPSHHLSHAASAFLCSPFDDAVILVADNMGSALGPALTDPLWLTPFERTSLFHAHRQEAGAPTFTLLSRHGDGSGELSLGAAYHYFTRWLGFDSYHEAGQVMALAACGSGELDEVRIFEWRDGKMICRMAQDHLNKPAAVGRVIGDQLGIEPCDRPVPGSGFSQRHMEVAWLIQSELERAWVRLIDDALAQTGARHVCVAGGVALNCVANTRLVTAPQLAGRLQGLFVQPASSDAGQALGNALWGYHRSAARPRRWAMRSDGLGRTYDDSEIAAALSRGTGFSVRRLDNPGLAAARRVASGSIIGWFQGGSEFGPRALGHRSIIGDPRTMQTKVRLDRDIKRRATFRPYAPALLRSQAAAWLELTDDQLTIADMPLRLMLLAPPIKRSVRDLVPAVVHIDGSARCQLIDDDAQDGLAPLVRAFHDLTGIPMVLNTSFNGPGEPIVETPEDALRGLFELNLDALFIGAFEVSRNAPARKSRAHTTRVLDQSVNG